MCYFCNQYEIFRLVEEYKGKRREKGLFPDSINAKMFFNYKKTVDKREKRKERNEGVITKGEEI